ncbi:MAG TPA: DJ-1/PfpI family protein [Methylomirabilota bacterium]|jgi:transcriptional regulator GlxA family with amidase domain|nr:DJ-1/PfpI family protein [Methylomirabilota bacterium]
MTQQTVGVLLFPEFELLDVFGPLEAFGQARDFFRVLTVAEHAGPVASAQGPRAIADHGLDDCPPLDILLVPGGMGTRREVGNRTLLDWIARQARRTPTTTSVCTGSALLAKAGVLDGRRATSNKRAFAWVMEQGPKVDWVRQARWVEDGNVVTSSGVSAGIDMALHLIGRLAGAGVRDEVATRMEYVWHDDAANDPFARVWGLV